MTDRRRPWDIPRSDAQIQAMHAEEMRLAAEACEHDWCPVTRTCDVCGLTQEEAIRRQRS